MIHKGSLEVTGVPGASLGRLREVPAGPRAMPERPRVVPGGRRGVPGGLRGIPRGLRGVPRGSLGTQGALGTSRASLGFFS